MEEVTSRVQCRHVIQRETQASIPSILPMNDNTDEVPWMNVLLFMWKTDPNGG